MHDTDTIEAPPSGGMGLRDHRLAASRLAMLLELSWVAQAETAEIYGENDPAAQAASAVAGAAEELLTCMRLHAGIEHPDVQAVYTQPNRPSRPVRPGREHAGQTG